jgi:hypothetical protein
MYQILIVLLLVSWGAVYWLDAENKKLTKNYAKLEIAVQEQKSTIEALETARIKQNNSLSDLGKRNNEIQVEMARYLDIFARHNLSNLAAAKPGLIEIRANNATKQVFDSIENDSRDIDALDDGVQLVPENPRSGDTN